MEKETFMNLSHAVPVGRTRRTQNHTEDTRVWGRESGCRERRN